MHKQSRPTNFGRATFVFYLDCKRLHREHFAEFAEYGFFTSGHLHLGHSQPPGGGLLGLMPQIPQTDEGPIPWRQAFQYRSQSQAVCDRLLVGVHRHIQLVFLLLGGEGEGRQRHRHRLGHGCRLQFHFPGQFLHRGLPP